jgi:hypothetical protein
VHWVSPEGDGRVTHCEDGVMGEKVTSVKGFPYILLNDSVEAHVVVL